MKDDSICLLSHFACPNAPTGPSVPAHRPLWFVRIWSPRNDNWFNWRWWMKGSLWSMNHKLVTVSGIMEKVYGSKGRMVLLLFDKSSPKQFVQSVLEFSLDCFSGQRLAIKRWLWGGAVQVPLSFKVTIFVCVCVFVCPNLCIETCVAMLHLCLTACDEFRCFYTGQ